MMAGPMPTMSGGDQMPGPRLRRLAELEAARVVESCRRFRFKPSPLIGLWTAPHVLGVARRA